MIDYDNLKMVSEVCNLSENKRPQDWADEEGIDLEGLYRFAKENCEEALAALPAPALLAAMADPRIPLMLGIVAGIRYANLLHTLRA
jgi:hypothetical protein